MNFSRKFYDSKYTNYYHPDPETILEHLFYRLRRYEYHRTTAAVDLLDMGISLLDIGVGCGGDIIINAALQKKYKKLFAIDISSAVIKKCQKKLSSKNIKAALSIQNIDDGMLTFKKEYFDAVTMIAVLEHVFDPHHALDEVYRILKRGGQFVLEVPNVVFLPRRLSFLFGKLPKTADEPIYQDGHIQFFTKSSLLEILAKHGFSTVFVGCSGIFSNIRNSWSSMLGSDILIKAKKI